MAKDDDKCQLTLSFCSAKLESVSNFRYRDYKLTSRIFEVEACKIVLESSSEGQH